MNLPSVDSLWRKAPELVLAAGVGAFLMLSVVLIADWWPHPTPIPPAEQTSLDSLRATKPDYQRRRDTLVRVDSAAVRQSRVNAARAARALATADSLHQVAIAAEARSEAASDSLAALASARLTITALIGETASLRVAVAQKDSTLAAQIQAHAAADARAEEAERRASALDDLNTRLANDVRHSQRPCWIVPHLLGCPSRTEAYVAGLATVPVVKVVSNVARQKPPLQGFFQ